MKTFTTMLMLVVATVAHAAAPTYHRLIQNVPVDVSADCNADGTGTGSFSFIVNGTMEDNGNQTTVTGTVVIAANKQTQYVKSFAGQWVEQTSSGNVTGTFSVKNFKDFIGAQFCFGYPDQSNPGQTGYNVGSTIVAPFKGRDAQGRRINGEINLGVSECNWTNTNGLICDFDGFFATWDSDGFNN